MSHHIDSNSIVSSLAGGGIAALLAKLYLRRLLGDIESTLKGMRAVQDELIEHRIRISILEKSRD